MPSQKQEKNGNTKDNNWQKKAIWALAFLWNNYQIMFTTTTTRRKLIIATTNSKNTQVVG